MSGPKEEDVARSDHTKPPALEPDDVGVADLSPVSEPKGDPKPPAKIEPPEPDPVEEPADSSGPGLSEFEPPVLAGDSTVSGMVEPDTTVEEPDLHESQQAQTPAIPPLPPDAEEQLKSRLAQATSRQDYRAIAEEALRFADQAIITDDADTARTFVVLAVSAARECKDDTLSKTAALRYLDLQEPLTEEVIEGAKKRFGNWKPTSAVESESSNGRPDSSASSIPGSDAPQRSLADLVK